MTKSDIAKLADALEFIGHTIQRLGNADACTPFGGLEALSISLEKGMESIASAIDNLADAIRESKDEHP